MKQQQEKKKNTKKSSALPKILPQPTDIHTQPEAKDSAVSHFQVLMLHHFIKKKTHRGKVKYNKNLNHPQRKKVQEHRNKTTKVILSSDKDHSSDGKRTKRRTRRIHTSALFKCNWSTSSGAAYIQTDISHHWHTASMPHISEKLSFLFSQGINL